MDYQDFILRIDARPGGGETLVVASPFGHGARAPFASPLGEEDLRAVSDLCEAAAEASPRRSSRHVVAVEPEKARAEVLEDVGDRLFRALFRGGVKEAFVVSLERAVAKGHGLRIRLRFDQGDDGGSPRAAALHRLPWELLYRREIGEFLALDRRTPLVRDLAGAVPPAAPPRRGPLVVLAVLAEPEGGPLLDLDGELRALERALRSRRGGAEVRPLRHATLGRLVEALRGRDVHALHFMGHGELEEETGEGLLSLEDDGGRSAPVSAPHLVRQLRDLLPGLRLVFLNACRTGASAAPAPWAGVAPALVRAGVGAVVAMQYRVEDRAAGLFSREVYRRLAGGDPVDAAVTEGRLALGRARPDSWGWATPALFLRAPDGRLSGPPAEESAGAAEPRRAGRGPRLVAATGGLAAAAAVVALLQPGLDSPPPANRDPGEDGVERLAAALAPAEAGARGPERTVPPVPPRVEGGADPPPATEALRELASGEPRYLEEVRATVTAELITTYGRQIVRLTVAPDEEEVQVRAAAGPGTVVFRWGEERVFVHVLAIDRQRGTIRLRASR